MPDEGNITKFIYSWVLWKDVTMKSIKIRNTSFFLYSIKYYNA